MLMANKWKIPDKLEKEIIRRDKVCVYCRVPFKNNSRDKATWEHIDNNENNICKENVALCCYSCNRNKGNKKLLIWLDSPYCKRNGINKETVAPIVKEYLKIH